MIFYFTGTGNSLMAAKAVAAENEQLIDMAKSRKSGKYDFDIKDGERIGFVFPVYCYTLNDVVLDFVRSLNICGEHFVFAIVTCGASIGGTGTFLANELAKKGLTLSYVTPLVMPDNGVFYYDLDAKKKTDSILETAKDRLNVIKSELQAQKKQPPKGTSSKALRPMYHFMAKTKGFRVRENCIGCGMCAKNCPDSAIVMKDKKPIWLKKQCTKCSACINRCPVRAIEFGKKTEKRNRYVNPVLKGGKA